MNIRHLSVSFAVVVATAAGVVACSMGSGAAPDAKLGTLSAALSGIGADGATYTLPNDSDLYVSWTSGSVSGTSFLALNSSAGSQTFNVAVGNYTGALQGSGSADAAGPWTLTRVADGGTSTVTAVLIDPQPYTFTIAAGQTSNLAFHFLVPEIGNVTFSTGTLNTSLSVEAGTAAAGHGAATGSATPTEVGAGGPPALATLLGSPNEVAIPYTISLTLTGPFEPTADGACANATGTSTATPVSNGGVEDVYAALATEPSGGTGTFCVYDVNASSNAGQVVVWLSRVGPANTSTLKSVLNADAGVSSSQFWIQAYGTPATPPYANGTADLSELSQPLTLSSATFEVGVNPGGYNGSVVVANGASVTVQLTP